MNIQTELLLVLFIPALIGFIFAELLPHLKTFWYYEISRKRKE